MMSRNARRWIPVALAVAGLGTAFALWDRAFPEAALDFRFSRAGIENRMHAWLASQGTALADYRHVTVFRENDETKNYIEVETGLARLNRAARQGTTIWHWYGRWFRPRQKEEFSVSMDPRGQLVGYAHTIEETRTAPRISKEAAQALAERFLQTHVPQHPFKQLRLVEQSRDQKTARIDYTFTWEQDDLRVKQAPYRLTVTIQGNQVGSYSESLKIPEEWTRWFTRRQELNNLCGTIALYLFYPLVIGAAVRFVLYARRGQLKWNHALPWGWLALLGIAALGAGLNSFPELVVDYDTTTEWSSYLMGYGSGLLRSVLWAMVGAWLLALVADPLYREKLAPHLPFQDGLGTDALRYRETLRSIGLGFVFACVNAGYVCLFYVVGKQFGAWAPVEVDYSKGMSGWFPWMESFQAGLSAAFVEEILFRVVGILLCWKLFRSRWLAVLLPAVTWAFMHSNYPQMPGYIRGIELTIVGVLWGALMLRYGVVTTLTAHYLYNSWLGGMVVIRSASLSDQMGSVVVSAWPLALGFWSWWKYARRGRLLEQPAPTPDETADPSGREALTRWWELSAGAWDLTSRALTGRRRLVIFAIAALALLLIHQVPQPQEAFRQLGRLARPRNQIERSADAILRQHGPDPASFHRSVSLEGSGLGDQERKYLLQYTDLDTIAALCRSGWPDVRWNVRYFRFGEKEEYRLALDQEGRLVAWNHSVPRESKGASLEKEAALNLARKDLQANHRVDLARERLVQDELNQQEHRRDYTFGFERTNWAYGESKLRTSVTVQGDEAVAFERRVKAPEAWLREESASGWRDGLAKQAGNWLGIALIAFFGLLFVVMVMNHLLPWKTSFLVALAPTAFSVVDWLNRLPDFYVGYSTTTPHSYFLFEQLGNFLVQTGIGYLRETVALGMALGLMRWAFGWTPGHLSLWPSSAEERRRLWLDALALALVGVAVWRGQDLLNAVACGWRFPDRVAYYQIPQVSTALPWLSGLLTTIQESYTALLRLAIKAGGAVIFYRRFPRLTWSFLVFPPLVNALEEKAWGEVGLQTALSELQWLLLLVLVWRVWRFNAIAIFLAYFIHDLLTCTELFLTKGGPVYRWQAIPLVIALLAPVVLALVRIPCAGSKKPGSW